MLSSSASSQKGDREDEHFHSPEVQVGGREAVGQDAA